MTDNEIVEGVCATQKRFNELLYQLKNNSSDTIPNLSDLIVQFENGGGKLYSQSYSYDAGIFVSYLNDIYVSKVASNSGNRPDLSPSEWQQIIVKNLYKGNYYASAMLHAKLEANYSEDYADFHILSSWNITEMIYEGYQKFKIVFDVGSSLAGNDYMIFTSDTVSMFNSNKYPVYHTANVIYKAENYIIIKMPYAYENMQFSLVVVPNQ